MIYTTPVFVTTYEETPNKTISKYTEYETCLNLKKISDLYYNNMTGETQHKGYIFVFPLYV